MAFPFVVRAGHYGGECDESQVAGPKAPAIDDDCECQSTHLNSRSWACAGAGARNPSPEARNGCKASDRV